MPKKKSGLKYCLLATLLLCNVKAGDDFVDLDVAISTLPQGPASWGDPTFAMLLDSAKSIISKDIVSIREANKAALLRYRKQAFGTADVIDMVRDVCSVLEPDGNSQLAALVLGDDFSSKFASFDESGLLEVLTNTFQLPIIMTGDVAVEERQAKPNAMVFVMRPNLIGVIRELLRRYNWRDVLYVFDSAQGLKRAKMLQTLLHTTDVLRQRTRVFLYELGTSRGRPLHQDLRIVDLWRSNTLKVTADAPLTGPITSPPRQDPAGTTSTAAPSTTTTAKSRAGTTSPTPKGAAAPPAPSPDSSLEFVAGSDSYVLRAIVDLSNESRYDTFLAELREMGMNRANYHWILHSGNMYGLDMRGFEKGGCNLTGFQLSYDSTYDGNDAATVSAKIPISWLDDLTNRGLMMPSTARQVKQRQAAVGTAVPKQSVSPLTTDNIMTFDALLTLSRASLAATKVYSSTVSIKSSVCPVYRKNASQLVTSIKSLPVRGLSGQISFDAKGHRQSSDIRVVGVSYGIQPRDIGMWNPEVGLTHFFIPAPNISLISPNKTVRVVSVADVPFLKPRTSTDGKIYTGNDRFEGFCIDLAEKVFKMLNLPYEIHLVKDGSYGREINGSWNGMIGELLRREADVAIAALTITSGRERAVSFTKPFLQTGISIMIKQPETQKPGVFSFMDPLSTSIWMCIIFAYAGVSLALFLVSRFSPYEWNGGASPLSVSSTPPPQASLHNTMWGTLGAIMQQGGNLTPQSFSGRLVASVWWFFCLILISSYTANLAAFLTVERMLTPVESAEDLVARQNEIAYGTVANGATQDYFRHSKLDLHKKMWAFMEKAKPAVFEPRTDFGVDRVRKSKGRYAFLLESVMNEYYNQRSPCNTMRVGNDLDSKGYGIAALLDSELKDDLNDAVLKLTESGDIQELHKKWWFDKGECPSDKAGKESSAQSPLTLSNVAGIFYILITGLVCAMFSAALEFIWNAHAHASKFRIPFATAVKVQGRFATHGLYVGCGVGENID